MDDLVRWLTGVWDEEEALAKKAAGGVGEAYIDGYGHLNVPRHQVLARIAADRKILAWCTERDRIFVGGLGDDQSDPAKYVDGHLKHGADSVVVRLLAERHADRPGYQESWAVQ